MDMAIGTFFGLSLSVGVLVAGITQLIKVADNVPVLDKLPPVRALLDTIVSGGHTYEKRMFVATLCVLLSVAAIKLDTGGWPSLSFEFFAFNLKVFFDATAGHALFLKGKKKKEVTE